MAHQRLTGSETFGIDDSGSSLSSKNALSSCHLVTASRVARQCAAREAGLLSTGSTDNEFEVMGFAIAAVVLSALFLEAHINELLSDLADGTRKAPNGALLAGTEIGDERLLVKYNVALALSAQSSFDKTCDPYQSVSLVIALRNVLVHYKPVWQTVYAGDQDPKQHNLTPKLKGRFPPSRLLPNNVEFWPYACLAGGCARWAVSSAIAFADLFNQRMKLTCPYEAYRTVIADNLRDMPPPERGVNS